MQASLVSARLVFALLVALFSAGDPAEGESSVLVDRIVNGALSATYLATEEGGAVALVRLLPQGAPQAVAFLERLEGASHLFTEVEHERVYSLQRFFAEEYTLRESGNATMELPRYPEAMIVDASRGADTGEAEDAGEESSGEGSLTGGDASTETPTSSWRFVRSDELLYLFPGESEEILVVRAVR